VKGCGEVSIYLASLVGASLGFLWYNAYPAQIFMGNSGAFALGAIVGTAAVLSKQELILPICGFLFVMEAGTTLLQILGWRLQRRRCFLMTPLHHHFELCGWVEPKIVVRFWLISIISSLVALLSLKIR
jgi:phospho-N-acetylmuramoyl-pentapeptide-transferase